jgi:hypothetical protein
MVASGAIRGGLVEFGSNVEYRFPAEGRSQISPIWEM